jgi:hypothetical protein
MRTITDVLKRRENVSSKRYEIINRLEGDIRKLDSKAIKSTQDLKKLAELRRELDDELSLRIGKYLYLPSIEGMEIRGRGFESLDDRIHDRQLPLLLEELITNSGQTYSELRYGKFSGFTKSFFDSALRVSGAFGKTVGYLDNIRFVNNENYRIFLNKIRRNVPWFRDLREEKKVVSEMIKFPMRKSASCEYGEDERGIYLSYEFSNLVPGKLYFLFNANGPHPKFVYSESNERSVFDWDDVEVLSNMAWDAFTK